MLKKYVLIVRDKITISKPNTYETYKRMDCYYESPMFYADGTLQSFDKAFDYFCHEFKHFIDWSAELIEV